MSTVSFLVASCFRFWFLQVPHAHRGFHNCFEIAQKKKRSNLRYVACLQVPYPDDFDANACCEQLHEAMSGFGECDDSACVT